MTARTSAGVAAVLAPRGGGSAVQPLAAEPGVFRFTVPGEPVPWMRAGRGRAGSFTRPRDALHREKIRAFARNAGIRRALDGAVRLDTVFYTSRPPLHPHVGDEDNYRKAVKDALQGIAYADDRQVTCGWTEKNQDAASPRTEMAIWMLREEDVS